MKNLCDNCKFAKWDMDSVENAYCEQNSVKVIVDGNYVNECSSYCSNNVFKTIFHVIKNVIN